LNHPNILTIHEVGELEGVHFIATEFIDGQTIRELIRTGRLSLREVSEIAIQLLSGLSAAHAAGIVHRDIKPENIMRRGDGIVKILDFGVAKLIEQTPSADSPWGTSITEVETEIGVLVGTIAYMSPEQMRCLPVDERTDIWSSGVVLHEMLTHRRPFDGATRADIIVSILEREPALLSASLDPGPELLEMQKVVSKALRKDVSERYQTAAEMLADLKAVDQQLEIGGASGNRARIDSSTSEQEVQTISANPSAHRFRLLMPGAVVLLAALMAGAFLYLHSDRRAGDAGTDGPPAVTDRLYLQMNETEQLRFIDEQEQRISAMLGDRPLKLNEEALRAIKVHVDRYAARQNTNSNKPGEERLDVIYTRAVPLVPLIARVFAERKIPIVVGIYLPIIESEYRPCSENSWGAKGLFQFLPSTAKQYGLAPGEMCDVKKMTPAAASYIADRMAELGEDSNTMTLVLLSYNRGPEWVVETLRQLRETDNYQRNFWTLYAHRDQLDDQFRKENAGYVPAFFAVAIIGENPRNFGLQIPPLSTLVTDSPTQR
jgi:hypothetical protein